SSDACSSEPTAAKRTSIVTLILERTLALPRSFIYISNSESFHLLLLNHDIITGFSTYFL
ncbi:hypothetical protein P8791_11645, partial [Bacillus subtilis]